MAELFTDVDFSLKGTLRYFWVREFDGKQYRYYFAGFQCLRISLRRKFHPKMNIVARGGEGEGNNLWKKKRYGYCFVGLKVAKLVFGIDYSLRWKLCGRGRG